MAGADIRIAIVAVYSHSSKSAAEAARKRFTKDGNRGNILRFVAREDSFYLWQGKRLHCGGKRIFLPLGAEVKPAWDKRESAVGFFEIPDVDCAGLGRLEEEDGVAVGRGRKLAYLNTGLFSFFHPYHRIRGLLSIDKRGTCETPRLVQYGLLRAILYL